MRWSAAILDEVVEHLSENVAGFNAGAGERLVAAMNGTFPNAEVIPSDEAYEQLAQLALPDEEDRRASSTLRSTTRPHRPPR